MTGKGGGQYDSSGDSSFEGATRSHLSGFLNSPAVKKMEDYQYHHSRHRLEEEELDCHERTNRKDDEDMSDIIDDGEWCPELHNRKYLVVEWIDVCKTKNHNNKNKNRNNGDVTGIDFLETFLRSIAWAIVTDRTVLFREVGMDGDKGNDKAELNQLSSLCDGND